MLVAVVSVLVSAVPRMGRSGVVRWCMAEQAKAVLTAISKMGQETGTLKRLLGVGQKKS